MPIPIQCSSCQQQYHVDDKLAGKKVRCRNCQAVIAVGEGSPEITQLEGLDHEESAGPSGTPICPSCKGPVPRQARVCLVCGYNLQSGAASAEDAPQFIDEKKKRRWQRPPGSRALDSVDAVLKVVTLLLLLGGLIVWTIRILIGPAGASFRAFLPLGIVLVLIIGLLAPLIAWAVSTTLRKLKILPRDDTYVRALVALLLPFSLSLFTGIPGADAFIDPLVVIAWALTPGLLLYLYRGDLAEAIGSFIAAFFAMGAGVLAIVFGAGPLNTLAGPLYADMLPIGPWKVLAHEHSPEPPLTIAATRPAETAFAGTQPKVEPNPAGTGPAPATQIVSTAPVPATQNTTQTAGPVPPATTRAAPPLPAPTGTDSIVLTLLESPWLTGAVANEPALRSLSGIVAAPSAATSFLAYRHDQSSDTVEHWSLAPPAKRAEFTFPLFPKKSNHYALSARGDVLAALIFFPRMQLEVVPLEGRTAATAPTPRRTIPLDEPRANPTLVGFLDPARVCVRWDLPDAADATRVLTRFQVWSTATGTQGRPIPPSDSLHLDPNSNGMALSPDGRFLAVLARDQQLLIYNTETAVLARRILPAGNLGFKLVSMCYSPDSAQIALYAIVADIPTVMAFRVHTGDPSGSHILSTPVPASLAAGDPPPHNHALLWPQGGQYWLVNGNDFIDIGKNKNVASLGAAAGTAFDARLAGPDSIVFLFPQGERQRAIIARINTSRLQAESEKIK